MRSLFFGLCFLSSCQSGSTRLRLSAPGARQLAQTTGADGFVSITCDGGTTNYGPFPVALDETQIELLVPPCSDGASLGIWYASGGVYALAGTAHADLRPLQTIEVVFKARVLGELLVSTMQPCALAIEPSAPQAAFGGFTDAAFPDPIYFDAPIAVMQSAGETGKYPVPVGEYRISCNGVPTAAVSVVPAGQQQVQIGTGLDHTRSSIAVVTPLPLQIGAPVDIEISLVDGLGQPMPNVSATLAIAPPPAPASSAVAAVTQPSPTDAQGKARATIVASSVGSLLVSAVVDGQPLVGTLVLSFTDSAASLGQSRIALQNTEAQANGSDAILVSVAVNNSEGLGVVGGRITLSTTCVGANCSTVTVSPSGEVVLVDGKEQLFTLTSAGAAEIAISATVQGTAGDAVVLDAPEHAFFLAPGTVSMQRSRWVLTNNSWRPPVADTTHGVEVALEARDITGALLAPFIEVAFDDLNDALTVTAVGVDNNCVASACVANGNCARTQGADVRFSVGTLISGVHQLNALVCDGTSVRRLATPLPQSFEETLRLRTPLSSELQPGNVSVTPDGRYWAYCSPDDPLGLDLGLVSHVYRYDAVTDTVDGVTCSPIAPCGSGDSFRPVLSDDGRFVAFESLSSPSSLGIAGATGPSSAPAQVFVRDMTNAVNHLVSINAAGVAANHASTRPDIAVAGSEVRIVFVSRAGDVDGNGPSGIENIFLWRKDATASIWRVTQDLGFASGSPRIFRDGSRVAFTSQNALGGIVNPNEHNNVFLSDVPATPSPITQLTLLSHGAGGPSNAGDGPSRAPRFGHTRDRIFFESTASDLTGSQAPTGTTLYLSNAGSLTALPFTVQASDACDSGPLNTSDPSQDCFQPRETTDERFLLLATSQQLSGAPPAPISNNGVDGAGTLDVYLYDNLQGTAAWISHGVEGSSQCGGSDCSPNLTADGRSVMLESNNALTTLASGSNFYSRVNPFLAAAPAPLVAVSGTLDSLQTSDDGRDVLFVANGEIVVADTWLRSSSVLVAKGTGWPYSAPSMSASGRYVAYQTATGEVWAIDRVSKRTWLMSVNEQGDPADVPCERPQIIEDSSNSSRLLTAFLCRTSATGNMPDGAAPAGNGALQLLVRLEDSQQSMTVTPHTVLLSTTDGVTPVTSDVTSFSAASVGILLAAFTTADKLLVASIASDLSLASTVYDYSVNSAGNAVAGAVFSDVHMARNSTVIVFACNQDLVAADARAGVDIYVRQALGAAVTPADIATVSKSWDGGLVGGGGNFSSFGVSNDGRFVLLKALAPSLVPTLSEPAREHVFLRDMYGSSRARGGVIMVDATPDFTEGAITPTAAAIAGNGRSLMFATDAIYTVTSPWINDLRLGTPLNF